jgi:hypothetical protein
MRSMRIRVLTEQHCGEGVLHAGSEHIATIQKDGMATFAWGGWQVYLPCDEWELVEQAEDREVSNG